MSRIYFISWIVAKQTTKSSKFKSEWGLLKELFLGIIEGLFSSPPIDNISQFQTAYHLAEKLEFKDEHANKNMLFWQVGLIGKMQTRKNLEMYICIEQWKHKTATG